MNMYLFFLTASKPRVVIWSPFKSFGGCVGSFCKGYSMSICDLPPLNTKRPYLSQLAYNQKNKGTLPSWTLKVAGIKVPSEFRFLPYWPRYGRFNIFFIQNQKTGFKLPRVKSKDVFQQPRKCTFWKWPYFQS